MKSMDRERKRRNEKRRDGKRRNQMENEGMKWKESLKRRK